VRCIFGPLSFRAIRLEGDRLSAIVVELTRAIYQEHVFEPLPILGDALEGAGCGCEVVDLTLGRK
jgi:hypothetical protein